MSFGDSLYRTKITIAASQVATAQTDFPLLLTEANVPAQMLNTSSGQSCLSGGGDLLVSTDTGGSNRLALDIRDCSPGVGGGTLTARTSVPSVSAVSDTDVYLWWGDVTGTQPGAADPWGRNAVYVSAYTAVWAFDEDPSGGAPQLTDRTGDGNDMTANGGMVAGDLVTGKIDKAWQFDGLGQYGSAPQAALSNATYTISMWIEYQSGADAFPMLLSRFQNATNRMEILVDEGGASDNKPRVAHNGGSAVNGTIALADGVWTHLAFTYNGSLAALYNSGLLDASNSGVTNPTGSGNVNLGSRGGVAATDLTGKIDEVWIRNDALSANDILTHYNNENAPGTFASDDGVTVLGGVTPFPFYYWYQ